MKKPSSSQLMQRLLSMETLANAEVPLDLEKGLQSSRESGEGVVEGGLARAGGRALAANVLWLDANPDAQRDLAMAPPGVVSVSIKPSYGHQ